MLKTSRDKLKDIGFDCFDENTNYDSIYTSLFFTCPGKFEKNRFYDIDVIERLYKTKRYREIVFLQKQKYKSILFDLSEILNKVVYNTGDAFNIYKDLDIFKYCPLQRGDAIKFRTEDNRHDLCTWNDGIYMWSGYEFMDLEWEHSDYGTIPKIFIINKEFALEYFGWRQYELSFYMEFVSDEVKVVDCEKMQTYTYYAFYFRGKLYNMLCNTNFDWNGIHRYSYVEVERTILDDHFITNRNLTGLHIFMMF